MRHDMGAEPEKAVLVGVQLPGEEYHAAMESMAELERLADTAGALVVGRLKQKISRIDVSSFLGRGKAGELSSLCADLGADLVICDRELSPSQARNLEEAVGIPVIDRSRLILDIFACRARTREGKLQVELAQLNYLLPRLTGKGIVLSRLGGGIGTRGPGETKLEVDRRRIRKRISNLRKEIEKVRRQREIMRRNRKEVPVPVAAIVGYTNAGKSTLLKKLTAADVLVEDKLFATLDPTTRRVVLPNNGTVLLTDTVGFINNLPHHLVAAFHATLEEVSEADILIHVIDISHPHALKQSETVKNVLLSLGAGQKPVIPVYNKFDLVGDPYFPAFPGDEDPLLISAQTGYGLDKLLARIASATAARRIIRQYFLPYDKAGLISVLFEKGRVLKQEHRPAGTLIMVELEAAWASRFEAMLKKNRPFFGNRT